MRFTTIMISAALLAFAGGCKSKKAAQANADPAPAPKAQEPPSTATTGQAGEEEPAKKLGPDSVFFTLERTPCFGACPAFKITIGQNGNATYLGRRFAPRQGRYVGKVDAAMMKALLDKVVAVDFFNMKDKYDRPVTDLPSTIVRVHADGKDKQVIGRVGAPQAFNSLVKEAEQILAPVEWTKVGDLR